MQELFACLKNAGVPGDWQHILNQIGMFSYTGLSKPQVQVRIFLMCCSRCCALVADATNECQPHSGASGAVSECLLHCCCAVRATATTGFCSRTARNGPHSVYI